MQPSNTRSIKKSLSPYQGILTGFRLRNITLVDADMLPTDAFNKWFGVFSKQEKFLSSMAPFAGHNCGPDWLRRKFPPTHPQHDAESKEIWDQFLKPTLVSSRLQSGVKG